MQYLEILKKTRTKREMKAELIDMSVLENAIEHVRFGASARNAQQIRFALFNDQKNVKELFENCSLKTSHNVSDDHAPSAFIVMGTMTDDFHDMLIGIDMGILYQIIREYLYNLGYTDVCIYSFDRNVCKKVVNRTNFVPHLLVAIGKSDQKVFAVDSHENGYFKDENNIHCVNKMYASDLIIRTSNDILEV